MSRNIYWTDENHKTINVAKLSDVTKWKKLVTDGLGHPRAIVVDPRNGHGSVLIDLVLNNSFDICGVA